MTDQELDTLAKLILNELNGMMAHDKLDYIKRRIGKILNEKQTE